MSGLQFEAMDVKNMIFENESYDFGIDKGTLDALKCGENFQLGVEQYLKEVKRVLAADGIFICISYGVPYVVLKFLNNPDLKWKVETIKIPKIKNSCEEIDGIIF